MSERRKHERVQRQISFNCYIDGQRFDSASVNLSQGGAFLKTPDPIPPDSVVVVVPREQFIKQFPVMLVGKVLRQEAKKGLGIRWLRCVTRSGLRRLWQFIESFPELWETIPPVPPSHVARESRVGFDFDTGQFFVAKGQGNGTAPQAGNGNAAPTREPTPRPAPTREPTPRPSVENVAARPMAAPTTAPAREPTPPPQVNSSHAGRVTTREPTSTMYTRTEAHKLEVVVPMSMTEMTARARPAQPREPTAPPQPVPDPVASARVESPPGYHRSNTDGAITQLIETQSEELPANINATCEAGGKKYDARVRTLGLNTAFILSLEEDLFEAEKLEVHIPVTLHQRTYPVTLACTVLRRGRHVDAGGPGIHCRINAVYQPQRPGIFERYVKFLYYQNVTQR